MLFLLKLKYHVILARFESVIKQTGFHFKETFSYYMTL